MGATTATAAVNPWRPPSGTGPSIGDRSAPGKACCTRLVLTPPAEAPPGHPIPHLMTLYMDATLASVTIIPDPLRVR
jgi:hypothetical protein